MTSGLPANVRRLRSAFTGSDDPRTDGQLLTAFRHDPGSATADAAFAVLVRRHGPRVLAVCRRMTGHADDAEDACQAAFLVLARRAADICPPDAVVGWLYGVAFRTAREARSLASRRRKRLTLTADLLTVPGEPVDSLDNLPAPAAPLPDHELAAAVDAEIAALPERLRAAVVLCELEGVSRKVAAARLGLAEGTLSSRLADARKRLAVALTRKGYALPAVLSAAVPVAAVESSHPALDAACQLGLASAAGHSLPAGTPLVLANLVTRVMFFQKLIPNRVDPSLIGRRGSCCRAATSRIADG